MDNADRLFLFIGEYEKKDTNGKSSVQTTNVAKKIEIKFWGKIMTMEFRGLYMVFIFLLHD